MPSVPYRLRLLEQCRWLDWLPIEVTEKSTPCLREDSSPTRRPIYQITIDPTIYEYHMSALTRGQYHLVATLAQLNRHNRHDLLIADAMASVQVRREKSI